MLARALGGQPRPETSPGVINLESLETPAFAADAKAKAPAAAEGAEKTPARPPTLPARRTLDTNTSASTPTPMPSRRPIVMVPQALGVLPSELAAPPASPVVPPLDSNSSSAASTSPLPRALAVNSATIGGLDKPAVRTRART